MVLDVCGLLVGSRDLLNPLWVVLRSTVGLVTGGLVVVGEVDGWAVDVVRVGRPRVASETLKLPGGQYSSWKDIGLAGSMPAIDI